MSAQDSDDEDNDRGEHTQRFCLLAERSHLFCCVCRCVLSTLRNSLVADFVVRLLLQGDSKRPARLSEDEAEEEPLSPAIKDENEVGCFASWRFRSDVSHRS